MALLHSLVHGLWKIGVAKRLLLFLSTATSLVEGIWLRGGLFHSVEGKQRNAKWHTP